jgi:hypothetical protein
MTKKSSENVFSIIVSLLIAVAILPSIATAQPFFTTPEAFGASGDGMHDDTVAVNAALASLEPGGRIVFTGKYLIASANVVIPSNVTFEGTFESVGTSLNNWTAPYANLNSAIILNSNYTIMLGGGSSIKGLLIYRQGQVFPAADATGFAGTAITAAGDDHSVTGCMILGFNQAIYSNGFSRPYYHHVLGDNNNFIQIANCGDIGRITDCHAWPFVTIAYAGTRPADWAARTGIAYNINSPADWMKITNSFALAYNIGINLIDSDSVTLLGCGIDGGNIGVRIVGQCLDVRLNACQIAAQNQAIYINTGFTPAYRIGTQIIDCDLWGNTIGSSSQNIIIYDGDAQIMGCHFIKGNSAVNISSPDSRVLIEGNAFDGIPTPIYNAAGSPYVFIGKNDFADIPDGTNVVFNGTLPTASVSGSTLNLPPSGDVFTILSGTANFSSIQGSFDGRVKTLIFESVLTIPSSTSPNGIRLSTGSQFTTAAGTTLSVIFSQAGYWVETGRSNP